MNIKHKINKYGFWIIIGLLSLGMIIINSVMPSPLSEFGCLIAVFAAEIVIWILDLISFGYKDSTVRLWLSGGVVAIIVGISVVVLGNMYIENFDTLDSTRPWMFMSSIITSIYVVSAHHVLLCGDSKKSK